MHNKFCIRILRAISVLENRWFLATWINDIIAREKISREDIVPCFVFADDRHRANSVKGARLSSLHHHYRGKAIGGTEHGSGCLRANRRSTKIHQCQRIDELSLLQRGKCRFRSINFRRKQYSFQLGRFNCLRKIIEKIVKRSWRT